MTVEHPIPDAALGAHLAIVGKTGSGKTYTAKGIVEHLLRSQRRVCIIDPTGAWWGLRSSADGKHAGFPVAVFGGEHADVPIAAGSGAALAEIIAKQNMPAVIDISEFLIGERHRFMEDFAATLYRENRTPLHLVIDEADDFAPQNPLPESKRMLHRVDQIVRRGRIRGFRVLLITQRPAVLHKNVLTQANTLIAMRLVSPQDRKAIEDWIKGQADVQQGRDVLNTLARLQRGEGWLWSPEYDVLERVQFPKISTFDSSRTPEDGESIEAPARLADVDLDAIRGSLAAAEEQAKANDPKLLKAEIARLNAALKDAARTPQVSGGEVVTAFERGKAEGLRLSGLGFDSLRGALSDARSAVIAALDEVEHGLNTWQVQHGNAVSDAAPVDTSTVSQSRSVDEMRNSQVRAPAPRARSGPGDPSIGNSGKRRMLIALAQNRGGLTYTKLSLLTGISQSGGTWRTYLGELRSQGLVVGNNPVSITETGLRALGAYDPLPTGAALIEYWRTRLGQSGKRAIFDAVVAAYPRSIAQERVSQATGITIAGGTWRTYLGELRGLELITGRGELRASEELFD